MVAVDGSEFFLGIAFNEDGTPEFLFWDPNNDQPRAKAFYDELKKESDRGLAIVGAAILDDILGAILVSFAQNPEPMKTFVERSNFDTRANIAFALGAISQEERINLGLIQKIRNKFAHISKATFETQNIVGRCNSLNFVDSNDYESNLPARERFLLNLLHLILEMESRATEFEEKPLPFIEIRRTLAPEKPDTT